MITLELAEAEIARLEYALTLQQKQIERLIVDRDAQRAIVERLTGENKTLRDTPTSVAVTHYRRMADERAHFAQECERLKAELKEASDWIKATVENCSVFSAPPLSSV